ncbi:MAG: hypothetical protein ACE5FS_03385 [Paracoccaceae bacterium]
MDIDVTISGVTPLLCHNFTDAAQQEATEGTRPSTNNDRGSAREQAEALLYLDNNGRPVIPAANLLRAIIDAGTYFKVGRSKITTQRSSIVPACVAVDPIVLPIKSKHPWAVDSRPVRMPATGGRILRHRPMFEDWSLAFRIDLDPDLITPKLLRNLVDAAGKRVGLGDFRPFCKGPFGRFVVTKWAEREAK